MHDKARADHSDAGLGSCEVGLGLGEKGRCVPRCNSACETSWNQAPVCANHSESAHTTRKNESLAVLYSHVVGAELFQNHKFTGPPDTPQKNIPSRCLEALAVLSKKHSEIIIQNPSTRMHRFKPNQVEVLPN